MQSKQIHMDSEGYKTVLINPIFRGDKPSIRSFNEKMSDVGANTGNMLFAEGIKDNIVVEKEGWLVKRSYEGVDKPACILPSANFIIYGGDGFIKAIKRFLDESDCPFTLAGLGAQSTQTLNTPKKLVDAINKDSIKCFQQIAERAVSLGIRGEFTAECLELMGIHNYRIIGCPSAYKFPVSIKEKEILKKPSLERCQITVTTGSVYESKIVEWGYQLNAIWLMQMTTEGEEYILDNQPVTEVWMNRRLPGIKISDYALTEYMKNKSKMFFDFKEWNEFYSKEDLTFSFGSRFHGNMAAFRNGVPALWITHDSRTSELTQSLHLPQIDQKKFGRIRHPEKLLEYVDYSDFIKYYPKMLCNYKEFLEENHISHMIDL